MGSMFEMNDTLQITGKQGFPKELDIKKHLEKPYKAADFSGKIFKFQNKSGVRIFHLPPCRVFLVQKINDKWLYWGLVHIISLSLDYLGKTTAGEFRIESIYTPEEMKKAHDLIDSRPAYKYFQ